jgi:ribosomal protein S18 acetylase RimI-like enzyme
LSAWKAGLIVKVFFFVVFAYNKRMQFELTSELIDEILFFMEDQNGEFLLDTRDGVVLNTEIDPPDDPQPRPKVEGSPLDDDGDRYISLPDWGPSYGFRLMERFAAGLRGTPVREALSAALDRGRGVFRAFKDTLTRYPETEKLWHSFKDREMKRVVISWYNGLRESWGMELIGEEPEDIVNLVLEDFRFREGTEADTATAEELHCLCLEESEQLAVSSEQWVFPGEICFVAETAGGEFAGYICVDGSDTCLRVCAVEVRPEYRGLGLGKTLTSLLLEKADSRKISQITIDLPAGREYFSRALLREDFRPSVQRYRRTISN